MLAKCGFVILFMLRYKNSHLNIVVGSAGISLFATTGLLSLLSCKAVPKYSFKRITSSGKVALGATL